MASETPRSPSALVSEDNVRYTAIYPDFDEWDDDDDDMDFVPAEEGEESDGDQIIFHDAEEGIDITFDLGDIQNDDENPDESNDGEEEGEDNAAEGRRPIYITRDQIMTLLGHHGLRRIFADYHSGRRRYLDDDDDDDEADTGYSGHNLRRKKGPRGKDAYPKVPSEKGIELMASGKFGTNDRREDSFKRKKKLQYRLLQRELGLGCYGRQKSTNGLMSQGLIPSSKADLIIHYDNRCYSGQFSDDGNFFFSCAQDFKVRMYDTSNPYNWKYYKTVDYPYGQWTITDASLSSDNKWLAYSSIQSIVCLASTDPENTSEPAMLDFSSSGLGGRRGFFGYFGLWSIRFSGDGREIVAGTNDRAVCVFDIERNQSVLRIAGHDDDVNAVCYGDAASPHILYSGSDDTTLKVWDRRSLADGREAGIFLGHTEGLTYVDSKGDGRYILSNGKDQTAKLWDLRNMMSTREMRAERIDPSDYTTGFEYRSNAYNENDYRAHPYDRSLVTFRGHSVLKTLIRCHFSPQNSTDGRYVYSGSSDGSVYIWNLDATLAGKINVLDATRNSRPRDEDAMADTYDTFIGRNGMSWQTCVRDASWHPHAPMITATAWNGWGTSLGTCTVHSWDDGVGADESEIGMGRRVNPRLEHEDGLYNGDGIRQEGRRSYFARRRGLRW